MSRVQFAVLFVLIGVCVAHLVAIQVKLDDIKTAIAANALQSGAKGEE